VFAYHILTQELSYCRDGRAMLRKSNFFCGVGFKVIEVGKPICDFLLVINSNWHPISYHFGVIAAYCSNVGHCVFEPPLVV